MQGRVRAAGDGEAVVPVVAPHEPHHVAHPRVHQGVRQRERQVLLVEGLGALRVPRIHHHVGESDRDRFLLLDGAVAADGDVGADLDASAFVVEEPEAVAAAGGVQGGGVAEQLHAVGGQLRGQFVDVAGVGGAERDQVDPLLVGLPQPDDVLLG